MALRTVLELNIKAHEKRSDDLGEAAKLHEFVKSLTMATGTGANQSDVVFSDRRTLAATSEDFDLVGALTGALGGTVSLAEVTLIAIHNTSSTAADVLSIGGAAATQFAAPFDAADNEIKVGPGGLFLLTNPIDGFACAAGTTDLLKIDAGAKTITFDIIVIGRSA